MGPGEDSEIVHRVVAGDVNAFEILVKRYRGLVFGIALRYVPADRAEDVAQEAFIAAFRSLGTFSHASLFRHWLSGITVRCCYGFWRQHYRRKEQILSSLSEDSKDWLDDVLSAASSDAFEREVARKEAGEILGHALGQLSAKDRMVVAMVHLEGLSMNEAAARLGWSSMAVKVRAHRSRQKLRRVITRLLQANRDR
ncbi:MAG: sigma-70 family RNA polymerase sigma factor [Desulfobacteraceae bacterium]|nr:sigma-70 family RNA polymerase sigma factor [Desulfobacteraceae bacterium]